MAEQKSNWNDLDQLWSSSLHQSGSFVFDGGDWEEVGPFLMDFCLQPLHERFSLDSSSARLDQSEEEVSK